VSIYVDTNVLIVLARPYERTHARAVDELARIRPRRTLVTLPCLTEAVHFLQRPDERERLRRMIVGVPLEVFAHDDEAAVVAETLTWLAKYAEHKPDFADGHLCALSARDRRAKVWTYDSEFTLGIWRRLDGSAVPMAIRP